MSNDSINHDHEVWISAIRNARDSLLFNRHGLGPVVRNRDELFRQLMASTNNMAMTSVYLLDLKQSNPNNYNPDRIIANAVNEIINERAGQPAIR